MAGAATSFLDMIVTDGGLAPERLEIFEKNGQLSLAISNETPATSGPPTAATIGRCIPKGRHTRGGWDVRGSSCRHSGSAAWA